jgi:hypothetical protein
MATSLDSSAMFGEFGLACWERARQARPALAQRWAQSWAQSSSGQSSDAGLSMAPWWGMAPLGALGQADPDFLNERERALALSVAFGAALEPQSSNPLWERAFLEACALCWSPEREPCGLGASRFARLCQERRPPGPKALAHDPALSFASDLARALWRGAHPETMLEAALNALGADFWSAQSLEGFHRDFQASFAERLACHMLALGLEPEPNLRAWSFGLSRLARVWSWILERGDLSMDRCADCVADAAKLAEMSWRRPGREAGPRAWRQACEAAWGPSKLPLFAEALRKVQAEAAAVALEPTPEQLERLALARAIDQAAPAHSSAGRL